MELVSSLKRAVEYVARKKKGRASILNMVCMPGIPAMVQNSPSATPTQQLPTAYYGASWASCIIWISH